MPPSVHIEQQTTLPIALILKGRRVLLVGGGRVAARKATKLTGLGATITVVAPSIKPSVRALPHIVLTERPFKESDLHDIFMVFALTNDEALNQRILTLCHERAILCSAADKHWPEGDFILPASFMSDGLTLSVHTGGRSCRRSRMLRESFARHVAFLRQTDLLMLGADINIQGVNVVEALKASRASIESALTCLRGVHEFMILDTCNRFEILGLVAECTITEQLLRDIMGKHLVLHVARGMDAFHRFAEITAGLHSQALGEGRISTQVKQALQAAQDKQYAGSFMQAWTDCTFAISKKLRLATKPLISVAETEDLVCHWIATNMPNVTNILIVGQGDVGQSLKSRFPAAIQISGRSNDELCLRLTAADLILCATGSAEFVIHDDHRPLIRCGTQLIDISLPRNIDPALPGVVDRVQLRSAIPPDTLHALQRVSHDVIANHHDQYDRLTQFRRQESAWTTL